MSARGLYAVVAVECAKLAAQIRARLVLATCLVGPFAFAAAIRLQDSLPEDTLFGRSVKESGFGVSLVILGFAALWAFPVLTSAIGGDIFAAEDRYGTWKTVLTRSRSRTELFAGKVLTALGFSTLSVIVLAASSVAAGLLVIGAQPLMGLSGIPLAPTHALTRVGLAWASALPPALALTGIALLLSVATKSSAAGIGLPVVAALTMQLCAMIDGPEVVRRLLITSAFGAWHGLLSEPPYYRPLVHGALVSGAYLSICVTIAFRLLERRDIGG